MDLAHALGEYLDYLAVERGSSPNTVAAYRRDLTRYLDWLAAEKIVEPADVMRPDVERHLEALAEAGLSPASLERAASAIKGFHRFMVLEGVCDELPTADMPLPAKPSRLPDVLSREQAAALLDQPFPQTPTGLRDRAVLEVLYGCGLRASELCGLDRRAVLLDEELLRVFGKGSKERLVYLNDACLDALQRYKKVRTSLPNLVDRDALFVSKRTGKRLSARRIEQIVARCLQSAGLSGRGFSPHKLRHTAATLMYQGGVDMLALKEILGHENVSTTQIYTHINREQLKKAVAASPLATQKYVEQKPSAPDAPDPNDGEYSPDGSESR